MARSRAPTFPHVTQQIRDAVGCEQLFPGSEYTADEVAFLRAVEAYRQQRGRRFLTATDYLHFFRGAGQRWLTSQSD